MNKPETRGGKRPNAGRKPKPIKGVHITTRIEPEIAEWLKAEYGLHPRILREAFDESKQLLKP